MARIAAVLARASAAAALVAVGLLAGPGTASVLADPATPPPGCPAAVPSIDHAVAQGDAVFVGTVAGLDNDNRWATVTVLERWHGADGLPAIVEVRGGPEPGTSTPIDRTYLLQPYLFAVEPDPADPGVFHDDACSATVEWSADLADQRPSGVAAAPGLEGDFDFQSILPLATLAGALIVAVIAYLVILRARRRPADWIR